MTNRLYYKDPIKALYMMREFGIKLECKYSDEEIEEYDIETEGNKIYCFKDSGFEYEVNTIEELLGEFKNFRKIYVAKESESIFEPKCEDEGRIKTRIGASHSRFNIDEWLGHGLNPEDPPKIIMRDNKHFFSPEIEEKQEGGDE